MNKNIEKYKYNPHTYNITKDKVGCDRMKIDIHIDTDKGDAILPPMIVSHKGQVSGMLKYAGKTVIPVVVGSGGEKT